MLLIAGNNISMKNVIKRFKSVKLLNGKLVNQFFNVNIINRGNSLTLLSIK